MPQQELLTGLSFECVILDDAISQLLQLDRGTTTLGSFQSPEPA